MHKDLMSMRSPRVMLVSKEEFNSGSFAHNLPSDGAAVFAIDDPFHSTDHATHITSSLLDDPRILAVGAEDWVGGDHAKVTVLPIGLESMLMVGDQGAEVLEVFTGLTKNVVPVKSRKYNVMSDAQLHIFPNPASGSRNDRQDMVNHVDPSAIDDWYTTHTDFANHLENHVAQSKLALCPEGNGLDTHRFYHAYALGTRCVVRENGGVSQM